MGTGLLKSRKWVGYMVRQSNLVTGTLKFLENIPLFSHLDEKSMDIMARVSKHRQSDRQTDSDRRCSAFQIESHGPIQFKGKTVEVEVFSVPVGEKI